MKREHRLRSRTDFDRTAKAGRRVVRPQFTVAYATAAGPGVRVGFSVGRRLGGAVTRNRIRRRLREAVRPVIGSLPPYDVVIVARAPAGTASVTELRAAFEGAAREAGLLASDGSLHNGTPENPRDTPGPPGLHD